MLDELAEKAGIERKVLVPALIDAIGITMVVIVVVAKVIGLLE